MNNLKCRGCKFCDGRACKGELPGMGGVLDSAIFIENVKAWAKYKNEKECPSNIAKIRLAPMAGGVQNIGWHDEKDFYSFMISSAYFAKLPLSIGDGAPDEKLDFGLAALKSVGKKGAVFLKPYPQKNLLMRVEKSIAHAEIIGVDTDSYNIITMRNQVSLEEKTPKQLLELRKLSHLPLAIKGIFSKKDIEIVKEVKPEIALISNHGGRIDRNLQSSADFLNTHGKEIAKYSGEVWVDGGIRTYQDVLAASSLGAKEVLVGRPIISAMVRGGKEEVKNFVQSLMGVSK
ncbi:MAG: alpha-hydroxy-acid oxidizing protein [Treponema sp.]